jgi:DNA polymerase-3 subunit alpha
MFLIYDTETTGLPRNYEAPPTDLENWPRLVQIAWQLHDASGKLIEAKNYLVKPDGFTIPFNAEKVHGISTEKALKNGKDANLVLDEFIQAIDRSEYVIGHNIDFDQNITAAEFIRAGYQNKFEEKEVICTKIESVDYCALPGGRGGGYKWPTLSELHSILFAEEFEDAHNAAADVVATARCFLELIRIGVIDADRLKKEEDFIEDFKKDNPSRVSPADIKIESLKEEDRAETGIVGPGKEKPGSNNRHTFCHLHAHSQYSVLWATPDVKELVAKAVEDNMGAVALTDLGNLSGAFSFVGAANKSGIKPIVGCELYLARERKKKKFTKDNPDVRHNQVLLAKNMKGYQNLSILSSLGYIEGLYGLYPRIDKALVSKYREGLIALTGGITSEIPELILNVGETQAEEAFKWWLDLFGDDFYVELNRHGLEEEDHINKILLKFARKYKVKVIAANNCFYLNKEDSHTQDILLCIGNAEYQSTPVGSGRGYRFGFPNEEFYFKTQEEMKALFADIPEAIENIGGLVEKIEPIKLERPPMMPEFPLPDGFDNEDEYLRHITYEGAKWRYDEVTDDIRERIDFELETIKGMGYPGYFLIVQDFLNKAREMDVSVGPGRGSAAGSVVAYCLHITDVDPLKFNLLFERFLNPDRISLPDIDIDFDEDGRDRILQWVTDHYGKERVAQIITFGKMAPKMAIRDIARVKQLPLNEADRLAKLIPNTPGTNFEEAYKLVPQLKKEKQSGEELVRETMQCAGRLEGTIRNTGTHACGVIIGRDNLINHIPLSITKEADSLATQFDGNHIENVGMLKMDFLGLKTLSIIRDTLKNIRHAGKEEVDIELVPYDDEHTYELYSKGDTNGIFQFESDGMKTHLRELKPNRFEDLIAMNALYRPGPMEYIPSYIRRKHGLEKIEYDIPEMEEILQETYGITVYQEQVMLLSQKLAKFTKGQADSLRKGMGKKKKGILDELMPRFYEGCKQNGIPEEKVDKIWNDWEAFAKYAFNKSHSTCYAVVSYRMAYLKAHYTAEFMAAVLSRNLNDIKKITFFLDECKHQGITVLGPDINESHTSFTVNRQGSIRFGLAAIKGLGESAVRFIIEEREENGPFTSIFDFAKRVNLRAVNKRSMEALAMAGAFDAFEGVHRAQYFHRDENSDVTFIEKVVRSASQYQEKQSSAQNSLFGGDVALEISDPEVPQCAPWEKLDQLTKEKEVTGLYITGHPLDDYRFEMESFCNITLENLAPLKINELKNTHVTFAGMVTTVEHRTSRQGKPFGSFYLEDFTDSFRFTLFSEEYLKFKHLLEEGSFVLIKAKVEPNRQNPARMEVRISHMSLLMEALEKYGRNIHLEVELSKLNENLINSIRQVVRSNPGDSTLMLKVTDHDEQLSVSLQPRKAKVNPLGVMNAIKEVEGVEFSVKQ